MKLIIVYRSIESLPRRYFRVGYVLDDKFDRCLLKEHILEIFYGPVDFFL